MSIIAIIVCNKYSFDGNNFQPDLLIASTNDYTRYIILHPAEETITIILGLEIKNWITSLGSAGWDIDYKFIISTKLINYQVQFCAQNK